MISIELKNVVKIFQEKKGRQEVHAVDGVNLSIHAGEIFGILGPNGAGKTTILRLLTGLYIPTAGEIYLMGQNTRNFDDRFRMHMGILTENHGSYENLTVIQNLQFFGSFYVLSNLNQRIEMVLAQMNLNDKKNVLVGKLSKGLKQRVALARVLLANPPFLFLDEPTSGLDPQAAAELRTIIKSLKSPNRTILMNSHNLAEVQKICDRVAILNAGKIMQMGTALELSHGLFKGDEMQIRVKTPPPLSFIAQLEHFQFIKHVSVSECNLTLNIEQIDEKVPEIVEIFHENHIMIMEMTRNHHNLEEIYLTLMAEATTLGGGVN